MKKFISLLLGFASLLIGCQQKEETSAQTSSEQSIPGGTQSSTQLSIPLCRGAMARLSPIDLPKPTFLTGIGKAHMAVSTKNAEAQRWFDQGLNLLHDFWHIEAYRAFREAIRADSNCAMGHWGLAMCQPGFASEDNREWNQAIDRAMALRASSQPLERTLIEATATLVKHGPDAAFNQFQTLIYTYSDNADAVAIAAIMMRQANKDMKGPIGDAIKTSLERALVYHPTHQGLLHDYIHILELRPDFAQALPAAHQMVNLVPNVPHITHMPGHLYYLAGRYDKAVAVYQQARRQDEQYHTASEIALDANQNYLHNLHFLAVAEAEMNHYEQALNAANAYANTTLSTTVTDGSSLMVLYEGRILPALVHIRFRQWQKSIDYLGGWLNKADKPINDPLARIYLQAMQAYSQGMLATETGDLANAQQHLNQLSTLMQQYNMVGSEQQGHMAFKPINETYDIMTIAQLELTGWLANRQGGATFDGRAFTAALELEKAIAYDEPPRLMYPVAESLGILHFRRNEIAQARQAFQQALLRRPNSPIINQYVTQTRNP